MGNCHKVLVIGSTADPLDEEAFKAYITKLRSDRRIQSLQFEYRRAERHTGDAAWMYVGQCWASWTTVLYQGACAVVLPLSYAAIGDHLLPRMWKEYSKLPVIYYSRERRLFGKGKQVYQVATITATRAR